MDGNNCTSSGANVQGVPYLYCANTFDQRQVVLVSHDQAGNVEEYYEEIRRCYEARMAEIAGQRPEGRLT